MLSLSVLNEQSRLLRLVGVTLPPYHLHTHIDLLPHPRSLRTWYTHICHDVLRPLPYDPDPAVIEIHSPDLLRVNPAILPVLTSLVMSVLAGRPINGAGDRALRDEVRHMPYHNGVVKIYRRRTAAQEADFFSSAAPALVVWMRRQEQLYTHGPRSWTRAQMCAAMGWGMNKDTRKVFYTLLALKWLIIDAERQVTGRRGPREHLHRLNPTFRAQTETIMERAADVPYTDKLQEALHWRKMYPNLTPESSTLPSYPHPPSPLAIAHSRTRQLEAMQREVAQEQYGLTALPSASTQVLLSLGEVQLINNSHDEPIDLLTPRMSGGPAVAPSSPPLLLLSPLPVHYEEVISDDVPPFSSSSWVDSLLCLESLDCL